MPTPRRSELPAEARRRNAEQFARVGGELRSSRKRRRLTQRQLGAIVGVHQSCVSLAERGFGGRLSMDTWQRLFVALDRRLVVDATRDPHEEPADAGHLALQELVLRLGRAAGFTGQFELPTRPATRHAIDIGLRSDRRRLLLIVEAWNSFGDVGAAARATNRKIAEAEAAAVALGADPPYAVRALWLVRATARNRALVARYPEVFASRFPGSSTAWVRALAEGTDPPREQGLVWADVTGTRIWAWRRGRSVASRRT